MSGLRGVVAILFVAAPIAAAPVPAPLRDEAVTPAASRLLRHDKVRSELKLSVEQQAGMKNRSDLGAAKLLTPAQKSRLRRIERQILGPAAFADPDVQKALRLTDSQKGLIADLMKQQGQRLGDYLAIFGNDDADNLKGELLAFRNAALKQIHEALSDEQEALWKDLTGEPAAAFDPDLFWLYVLVEERLRAR